MELKTINKHFKNTFSHIRLKIFGEQYPLPPRKAPVSNEGLTYFNLKGLCRFYDIEYLKVIKAFYIYIPST